jgi:hypothetical protein
MKMRRFFRYMVFVTGMVIVSFACNMEYDIFVEPKSEFSLEKTTFDVLEPVYVTNLGTGERFTFWPGDEGQDYAEVENSRNSGLSPNRGDDFEYAYLRSGAYTMTVIASSFNEETGELAKSINSVEITINPGNNGNNFTRFAIDNAFAGYSPEGIIEGENITIPIGFINRASGISDTDYAALINKRPPLFSVNSSTAKVYSEEGQLLIGRGDDNYNLNVLDETTLDPIIRKFTVIQDDLPREYRVAAMFYPEIETLKVMGFNALKYSKDGLNTASEEEIKQLQLAYPDQSYFGVFVVGADQEALKNAIIEFELDPGTKLYLKQTGQEILSGVTPVDISNPPVDFQMVETNGQFSVTAEFSLYTLIF